MFLFMFLSKHGGRSDHYEEQCSITFGYAQQQYLKDNRPVVTFGSHALHYYTAARS